MWNYHDIYEKSSEYPIQWVSGDTDDTISPEKLAGYAECVSSLSKNKKNLCFPNTSSRHASIILSTALRDAKDILIYEDDGWDEAKYRRKNIKEALATFMREDSHNLKVILTKQWVNSYFYSVLKELQRLSSTKANVDIHIMPERESDTIRNEIAQYGKSDLRDVLSAVIGDDTFYRIEQHGSIIGDYRARWNFNGQNVVSHIQNSIASVIK